MHQTCSKENHPATYRRNLPLAEIFMLESSDKHDWIWEVKNFMSSAWPLSSEFMTNVLSQLISNPGIKYALKKTILPHTEEIFLLQKSLCWNVQTNMTEYEKSRVLKNIIYPFRPTAITKSIWLNAKPIYMPTIRTLASENCNIVIETHIIGHYNPSARIIA